MKFYTEDIVNKARKLKKTGLSGKRVSKILNIPDTTILRWCTDIPSNNKYHLKRKEIHKNIKIRASDSIKNIDLNPELARLFTSILYWCEGAKYPSTNFISFANSDVELIKTFLKLFRIGFKPKEEKFKVSLQIHSTHNKEKVTNFWSETLKIPKSQFHKPTITKPTTRMKRRDYKGTCTVKYYDVSVLLTLMGIYESFIKKIK